MKSLSCYNAPAMKRVLYVFLAVAVVSTALVVGAKLKETAGLNNGEAAIKAEVDRQIDLLKKQQPALFRGKAGKAAEQRYRAVIEERVRVNKMIVKEARVSGVRVSSDDVERVATQARKTYAADDKFRAALDRQNLTVETFKAQIREQLIINEMTARILNNVTVSDGEAKAFYKANRAEFKKTSVDQAIDIIKQRLLLKKRTARFNRWVKELKKKI